MPAARIRPQPTTSRPRAARTQAPGAVLMAIRPHDPISALRERRLQPVVSNQPGTHGRGRPSSSPARPQSRRQGILLPGSARLAPVAAKAMRQATGDIPRPPANGGLLIAVPEAEGPRSRSSAASSPTPTRDWKPLVRAARETRRGNADPCLATDDGDRRPRHAYAIPTRSTAPRKKAASKRSLPTLSRMRSAI